MEVQMVYKEYANDDYSKWLSKPFSDNYGITEDTIANWFMAQRGAKPVINSYGITKANLLSNVIPTLKAGLNGGYINFLLITVAEGGGAGNWINHYAADTAHPLQDDINYVNTVLNGIYPPAKSAPEVLSGTPYTDDPGQNTQAFYDALPTGSIGAYYMPSTMAGNAWVFASNWCVANAVYFGNPYDQSIDTVKSLGGDPFGNSTAKPDPGLGSPQPTPNLPPAKLPDADKSLIDKTMSAIKSAMTYDVYNMSDQSTYSNDFVVIEKTFNNTYHVRLRGDWLTKFEKTNNTTDMGVSTATPPDTSTPNHSPISGSKSNTAKRIIDWCRENIGKAYDMDGYFGAQCVDMIAAINKYLNLNLNTANYNGSYFAKDIYNNALPSGWNRVAGDPANDANSANIWNGLPDGAIVWFTNASAGHVAVKSGGWATCIQQNYGVPGGTGGPMLEANDAGWIQSGGAGFLGAWVPTN